MIVAIDGTATSGKSTLAKRLAKKLGFVYCNTGAIYRAIAIKITSIYGEEICENEEELVDIISKVKITESYDNGIFKITLDGEDVTDKIHTPFIDRFVGVYSKIGGIRKIVRTIQKEIATSNNSVVEGRDIGTVVFPNAEVKFYISADDKVRAQRRYDDYKKSGKECSFEEVLREIKARDELDFNREISPLKPAEDAIIIDNSGNDPDKMVDYLADIVNKKRQNLV